MACKQYTRYPIGTPGEPWGDSERQTWLAGRRRVCDYFETIVSPLHRIPQAVGGELVEYGAIDYRPQGSALFPLFAFRSAAWDATLPMAVITGGVHGYELGSLGAIDFIAQHFQAFVAQKSVNLLLLPCVAPWGLEMCERWTPRAVDPNRAFKPDGQSEEATLAMKCIAEHRARSKFLLLHMDLHETTDTDNTEFTPARFARDGLTEDKYEEWYDIPDGFYIYGDSAREKDQLEFSKHIIAAVEKVTHIAAADDRGKIVGEPIAAPGVLLAPGEGTADAHTDAMYVTTTEVYPDSQRTSREECNRAQAAAIVAGLEFALAHQD